MSEKSKLFPLIYRKIHPQIPIRGHFWRRRRPFFFSMVAGFLSNHGGINSKKFKKPALSRANIFLFFQGILSEHLEKNIRIIALVKCRRNSWKTQKTQNAFNPSMLVRNPRRLARKRSNAGGIWGISCASEISALQKLIWKNSKSPNKNK